MSNDNQRDSRVLITDTRAEILENYNSENSTHRQRKMRLENSTRTAFAELVEIAESDVIDNSEAFPQDRVIRFLGALVDHGGLEPPLESDEYRDDLRARLGSLIAQLYVSDE